MKLLEKFYALHDGMTYDNLHFDTKNFVIAVLFVWAGAVIGFIASYYISHVLGGFVKKLESFGATSPEDAETLENLCVGKHALVRLSLRKDSSFRKTVLAVGEAEGKKTAADALAFYIPAEKMAVARQRYCKKENKLWVLVLCILLSTVIAVAVAVYGPDLIKLLDNIITNLKG